MPRYEYECDHCEEHFDMERPMSEASNPQLCPFCERPAQRVITVPKFLFKPDPNDVRPVWHNHGSYGHSHAPGKGFHGPNTEDPHR
jgi:putative FmdB family regulatory protein